MNFLAIFLIAFFSFQSLSEKKELWDLKDNSSSKKAWSVSVSHDYSRGLSYAHSDSLSNSITLSLNETVSISTAYIQSFNQFISDTSPYGFTDTSISVNLPFPFFVSFIKNVFNLEAGNSMGVTLPSSLRSRRVGNYGSAFVSFYYFKKNPAFQFSFNHIFYSGFYKYTSDISGYIPSRLASTSHSLSLKWRYKKISIKASGRFYLYVYLADHNPDPEIEDTKIKFKGAQGGSLSVSWALPHSLSVYARSALNIPIVSPILRGFPLFNSKNISYSSGLAWNF